MSVWHKSTSQNLLHFTAIRLKIDSLLYFCTLLYFIVV